MRTRKAKAELTWNGAAITTDMEGYKGTVTYTDPAEGESDSIDVEINDRDGHWADDWLPQPGDTMTAKIKVQDWDGEGDDRELDCGAFVLDDFSFSGWPRTGTISAVSVPADRSFRASLRNKVWEKATLQAIGSEIASRAGISLSWEVSGSPPTIQTVEQIEQTDCEFFTSLCQDYGLFVKVYSNKLVVFDREDYKAKGAVATIRPSDIQSWSWRQTLDGTYTGGEYTYTDPTTEEEIKVTVGDMTRPLKLNGKADDQADAQRKLNAAIANANHGAITMTVTITGRPDLVSTQCIEIADMGGPISGKYFLDKVTSRVGGGYTVDLEMSKVVSG